MQGSLKVYGVDIAKDEVVTAQHGDGQIRSIVNEKSALDAWLATLPKGSIIAMESTGVYHRLLAQRAHDAAMQVYVLNAQDVYFYAKAMGARGKTDRVDAPLIARYVAEHHTKLHAWQPGDSAHRRVEELLGRRATVVTKRESVRQAFKGDRDVADELEQLDQSFARFLAALDAKIDALIAADQELTTGRERIASVTGFGPLGSALLAVLFARIEFANVDAVVAYSGLDPRPNDSGKKRGRRSDKRDKSVHEALRAAGDAPLLGAFHSRHDRPARRRVARSLLVWQQKNSS